MTYSIYVIFEIELYFRLLIKKILFPIVKRIQRYLEKPANDLHFTKKSWVGGEFVDQFFPIN